MNKDSILHRIVSEHLYLEAGASLDRWPEQNNHYTGNYTKEKFLKCAEVQYSLGSCYLLYSIQHRRIYAMNGVKEILNYPAIRNDLALLYNKMHKVSQFFNSVAIHLLLKGISEDKIVLTDIKPAARGLCLYPLASGSWLLLRRDLYPVPDFSENADIHIGEILTPVCTLRTELLPSVFPLLSQMEFNEWNSTHWQSYLQRLINDSEIFSQHQFNIINAMKENHNYQHSLRTLADENGVNYETLKTQTQRIRDKINELFKANFNESTAAIRFIILSNLI